MAFSEPWVYLSYGVIDNADGCFYCLVLQNEVIDRVLSAEIVGCLFEACEDEDVEIWYIFIGDMAVGLCMFDPLAASVLAEKDEHVCGWELAADDFNDEL